MAALSARGWMLGVAESLTGGDLTSAVVSVPGASHVLRGGFVVYATDLKATVLGVDTDLLAQEGPVHPRVASQMARGVRVAAGAPGSPTQVGVATTGVAGPEPQGPHPVGRVFVAVSTPTLERVEQYEFTGDRRDVRATAVLAALRLLQVSL